MSLIIPPGFAQGVLNFTWTGDGEPMVSTIGLDVSDAGGDGQSVAEALHVAFGTTLADRLSDPVTFTHATVYMGQDGGGTIPFDSTGDPVPGTADGASLPSNCAYLLRKRTGLGGRRGRGRMYLPGVGEDEADNLGNLPGAWLTTMQDRADDFMAALLDDTVGPAIPPVVLHRSEGIGAEPVPTPITVFQMDGKIATQRQRLRR